MSLPASIQTTQPFASARDRLPIYIFPGTSPSRLFSDATAFIHKIQPTAQTFVQIYDFFKSKQAIRPGLYLISLETRNDILLITHLMHELRVRHLHWQSQVMIVSEIDHPKLCESFLKQNCIIISKKLTTPLALQERVLRQYLFLEESLAKTTSSPLLSQQELISRSAPFAIQWSQSLFVEDDIWFIPLERFVSVELDLWEAFLLGPKTDSMIWIQVESDLWRWGHRTPTSANPDYHGSWFFRGSRPTRNGHLWKFSGKKPELYFLNTKGRKSRKLFARNNSLIEVAPNSCYQISQLSKTVPTESRSARNPQQTLEKRVNQIDLVDSEAKVLFSSNPIFQPIEDSQILRYFLQQSMKANASFVIWKSGGSSRARGTLTSVPGDDLSITLQLSPEDTQLISQDFQGHDQATFCGNFNLDLGSIFFLAPKLEFDLIQRTVKLFPDRVFFRVQRRKEPRIPFQTGMPIKILDPLFRAEILNFSKAGLNLILSQADYQQLREGKSKPISLQIGTQVLACSYQIRWARSLPRSPGEWVRTGIQFKNLTDQQLQLLDMTLFEMMKKA